MTTIDYIRVTLEGIGISAIWLAFIYGLYLLYMKWEKQDLHDEHSEDHA